MTENSDYLSARRVSFPGHEEKEPWLGLLLDAYHLVDEGVADALEEEQSERPLKIACSKGCANCCKSQSDIPIYPLEMMGISWYINEVVEDPIREQLLNQMENYTESSPCPFLLNDLCAVHVIRPVSCRIFMVFNKPCEENEDPYFTRRDEVLSPIKSYIDEAFFVMLPFYGVEDAGTRMKLIENGDIHKLHRIMKDCNWNKLAESIRNSPKK